MAKVLYTSAEVRKKVIDVMKNDKCKRTIVVAFVGDGAEAYLGKPKGINLICWPNPSSTNPKTLRSLIKKGVKLQFCDKLHMKIYSSEKEGTVITSANLTTNALGIGNLKEAGVYLRPDEFQIKNILDSIHPRTPKQEDFEKLDVGYQVNLKNGNSHKEADEDFLQWYTDPFRSKFKIAVYNITDEPYAKEETEEAMKVGYKVPEDSFHCDKDGFKVGDWIISIEVINTKMVKASFDWMQVDAIVKVNEKTDLKYRALQLWKLKTKKPPFRLSRKLKDAIFSICNKIGIDELNDRSNSYVSEDTIRRIVNAYKKNL